MRLGLAAIVLVALVVATTRRPAARSGAHPRPPRAPWRVGRWIGPGLHVVIRLGRRRGVVLAPEQSLLVVGPTRSGKTRAAILPNLGLFEGPVVLTSVKEDVLEPSTLAQRRRSGAQYVLGATPLANARWDPVAEATSVEGAAAVAHSLVASQPHLERTSGDTRFWYQLAEPVVAAALRGAKVAGRPPLELIDRPDELYRLLDGHGVRAMAEEIAAVHALEERQRDSVLLTVRQLLLPFAGPGKDLPVVAVDELLAPRVGTVCLVADLGAQQRLETVFATLLGELVARLVAAPRERPWLVLLDELANIAPIPGLERFASVGVGHGVRLVSVVQDLSQLQARYPTSWGSIVNNHRARLFLGSSGDPLTRSYLEGLGHDPRALRGWLLVVAGGPPTRLYRGLGRGS